MLISILSGLWVSVILSSNIYAQQDLNFQYGNFPNNLAETVEKASENANSLEMKLLECVTYSNSAALKESREMYEKIWLEIQPIIINQAFSLDTKLGLITFKWNAIDTMDSPISFVINLCAKSYDETGKFLQEIDELVGLNKP